MPAFRPGTSSNAGTHRLPVAYAVIRARRVEMSRFSRYATRLIGRITVLSLAAVPAVAMAQVPIPVQEQIRLFNSMNPAQQQALIRELQRSLPPAQRDAIIGLLQNGGTTGGGAGASELDTESQNALRDALEAQQQAEDEEADRVPRLDPGETIVIQFQPREDDPAAHA